MLQIPEKQLKNLRIRLTILTILTMMCNNLNLHFNLDR
jgi:hypothetical protein